MTTATLTIRGDTRPIAATLKKAAWRWDAAAKCWRRSVTAAQAATIMAGGDESVEMLRSLSARHRGCQTLINRGGLVSTLYTSPTYIETAATGFTPSLTHIPGSAPEERY